MKCKYISLVILFFISIAAITSCNDDNKDEKPVKERIVGTWQGDNLIYDVYIGGIKVDSLSSEQDMSSLEITLNQDGTCQLTNDELKLDGTWTLLENDTKIQINGIEDFLVFFEEEQQNAFNIDIEIPNTAEIQELTETSAQLYITHTQNVEIPGYPAAVPMKVNATLSLIKK